VITFFTATGRQLDLGNPKPADISIEDIIVSLANLCRYTGQIRLFYAVGQHACLVGDLVRPAIAFPALNHDNPEAYIGDMSSKLKHRPEMAWFRELEAKWDKACGLALGYHSLTPEEKHEIKVADDLAAVFERVTLRYQRDFKVHYDLDQAVAEEWITHSTAAEMREIAPRLPKYMTYMTPDMVRAQFAVRYARFGVAWRQA
jgi:5'-deoxynucleotidase YfbR-like HD superfamily hydrolase